MPPKRNDGSKKTSLTDGNITIDGKVINYTSSDQNIVDIADRAKISIPAPCYRAPKEYGCCGACVVEINGEQNYACATVPEKEMDIVVDRADLKEIRKQKLKEYKDNMNVPTPCGSQVSGSESSCG